MQHTHSNFAEKGHFIITLLFSSSTEEKARQNFTEKKHVLSDTHAQKKLRQVTLFGTTEKKCYFFSPVSLNSWDSRLCTVVSLAHPDLLLGRLGWGWAGWVHTTTRVSGAGECLTGAGEKRREEERRRETLSLSLSPAWREGGERERAGGSRLPSPSLLLRSVLSLSPM